MTKKLSPLMVQALNRLEDEDPEGVPLLPLWKEGHRQRTWHALTERGLVKTWDVGGSPLRLGTLMIRLTDAGRALAAQNTLTEPEKTGLLKLVGLAEADDIDRIADYAAFDRGVTKNLRDALSKKGYLVHIPVESTPPFRFDLILTPNAFRKAKHLRRTKS